MNKKEEGVPDFVLMDQLTEDAIMDNLSKRFKADTIYVCIFWWFCVSHPT